MYPNTPAARKSTRLARKQAEARKLAAAGRKSEQQAQRDAVAHLDTLQEA